MNIYFQIFPNILILFFEDILQISIAISNERIEGVSVFGVITISLSMLNATTIQLVQIIKNMRDLYKRYNDSSNDDEQREAIKHTF